MTGDRDTLIAAFDVADELAEFRLRLCYGQRLHSVSGVVIFLTNITMLAAVPRFAKRTRAFGPGVGVANVAGGGAR